MKKFCYWIILVLLAGGVVELFSHGGLHFLSKYRNAKYDPVDTLSARNQKDICRFIEQKTKYIVFHPTLGWSIRKNGTSRLYQANSSSMRSDREYAITPPADVRRISTFGDSFTHCDDVENDETWQAAMESCDPGLEVLNFGVGGFGLDQAFLRYLEEGSRYESDIVLIGFMSENIKRNVNTFRPFYNPETGIPLAKPRFLIEDGCLSLVPNPMRELNDYKSLLLHSRDTLPEMGANDYYYKRRYTSNAFDWSSAVRLATVLIEKIHGNAHDDGIIINGQYNENSEAFRVTKKIIDEFCIASEMNRSMPIVLLFPNREDVTRYRRDKQKRYSVLLRYFDSVGYRYIDLMEAFDGAEMEDLVEGHYSPLANKLVAKYIYERINK